MRDLRKTDFGGRGNAMLSEEFYQELMPGILGKRVAELKLRAPA